MCVIGSFYDGTSFLELFGLKSSLNKAGLA